MSTPYKIFSLRYIIYLFVGVLIVSTYGLVYAINTISTGFQTTTTHVMIDAHSECRQVRHTGSQSYFVPTASSAEWTAFRNNAPSDIDIGSCYSLGSISSNGQTTCGIRTDGRVMCWGDNQHGQLGDGTTINRQVPTLIQGSYTFKKIILQAHGACGLTQSNNVVCWGFNFNGAGNYLPPSIVSGSLNVNDFGFNGLRAYVLTYSGQIFQITNMYNNTTVLISGSNIFETLTVGSTDYWDTSGHACGLLNNGRIMCWGHNEAGELGRGFTSNVMTNTNTPDFILSDHIFTHVAAFLKSTCGIRIDGRLMCWGGFPGDNSNQRSSPVLIAGSHTFIKLSKSDGSMFDSTKCSIRSDNQVMCWGNNSSFFQYGQIGDGTNEIRLSPTLVSGNHAFESIFSNGGTTCGIRTDGRVMCWGLNNVGQVGDGTTTNRLVPTLTSGNYQFKEISGSCGIRTDGRVMCWGANNSGQVGDGTTTNRLVPTLTSGGHTFGN